MFKLVPVYEHAQFLKPAKRNILKTAGMFYDPLGLPIPITVRCKTLIQEICKWKYAWGTFLSEDLVKKWTKFLLEMCMLWELRFMRSVLCWAERNVQLHDFADNSGVVFCAVIYVRVACSHWVSCNLWATRSRLVPTKDCSRPRLELSSCFLWLELMVMVKNAVEGEVKIEKFTAGVIHK